MSQAVGTTMTWREARQDDKDYAITSIDPVFKELKVWQDVNGDQQFIITKVTNLLGKLHSSTNQEIPEMIAVSAINTGARGEFSSRVRVAANDGVWGMAA